MIKLYTLLVVVLVGFVGEAQIINFPDANFKMRLLSANATNPVASIEIPDLYGNVTTYGEVDTDYDGQIEVNEALAIKWLDVSASNIADLTGIENFTNLQVLFCSNNQLTSLNVSGLINLKIIYCSYNHLTSLNVSGLFNLQYLNCANNQFSSLNVSGLTNLKYLLCLNNQLTSLDLSGLTNLISLYASFNQLSNIDISGLTNLQSLNCDNNQLSSINVSGLISLKYLDCSFNQLPSLNVSGLINLQNLNCSVNQLSTINLNGLINLISFECFYNQFTTLELSGLTNLTTVRCFNNQITNINETGLPALSYLDCSFNQFLNINVNSFTNLEYLNCSHNQLSSLNLTGLTTLNFLDCKSNQLPSLNLNGLTNLQSLACNNNQLSSLNLVGLINLSTLYCYNNQLNTLFIKNGSIENNIDFSSNPSLEYICADENQISVIQNLITQYGFTNCHVNSYCSFTPGGTFYTIQGNNHYDSNSNGCDISDINFPYLNLAISDGTNTSTIIPDASGLYHYDIQAGTQTLTPTIENPTYFSIAPTTVTVDFPTATSPFVQDFCVTANGVHNDLEVVLLPLGIARPGFDANYKIIYKNKGTGTQSGSVSLNYNDAVLDLVSAIPTLSSQATNSLSWSFTNLLPFETREIAVTLNVNSPMETPAVNGGDVLNYTTSIVGATDETPTDNTATLAQTVVNSFDPNDKTCLEGTVISPSMVGQYVHYLIRFENTGTFAAENIVVRDIIDTTKFDINSLVPSRGSHQFVTRIVNSNQVEFIFENINLPFDDANNDGYVAFKIKTKPTLVVGDTFSNSANIYFDYNFPIVTNTTSTTIQTLGTQDFDFGSAFTLSPIPAKNSLTITSKQDVILTSFSIYNTLGQVMQVNTNPNETIDVSGLQSGNYFIRITSDKGSATGKFIKE